MNLDRAYVSLTGLWVGDAFGSHYEFDSYDWLRPKRAEQKRELPPPIWRYTDDTLMALSIYDIIRQSGEVDSSKLAESFGNHFDIDRGYGSGAEKLIFDIREGGDWKILAESMFDGTGSFGNGSAMRVAPIGAYFADDMDAVVKNARRSSIVTHTHPDGIAGAIAIAIASAQASLFSRQGTPPDTKIFWETILTYTPESKIRENIEKASKLGTIPTAQTGKLLGTGWDISAVDTVPFALWVAIHHITDFEEALWQAISVGGDTDTVGAIVGGIIASYGGAGCMPQIWIDRCEPLPDWIAK